MGVWDFGGGSRFAAASSSTTDAQSGTTTLTNDACIHGIYYDQGGRATELAGPMAKLPCTTFRQEIRNLGVDR